MHLFFCAFVAGLMVVPLLVVVHVDEALYRRHVAIFFEALRLSDLTKEKACQWMGIDKNQLRRQTEEREGHISFTRMMALPPVFFQWWALLLAEEFGVPKLMTRGVRVYLAVRTRRQVRMTANSSESQTA